MGTKWGQEPKQANNHSPIAPLDERFVYALEFANSRVSVRSNELQADGSTQTIRRHVGSGGTYSIASKFQVILEEWENDFSSYYSFTLKRDDGQGGGYVDMTLNFSTKKVIQRQKASNVPNRLACLFNTAYAGMGGMVRYSAAVDDDTVGFTDGAFQIHTSNTADISNRLVTIFSNNVEGTNTISDRAFATMQNVIASSNYDEGDDRYDRMYRLAEMPNADILSWDSNSDDGILTSTSSYASGIHAEGAKGTNDRDFASFYLSIPSLPIQNYTGNHL